MPVRDKMYKEKSNSKHIGSTTFQKSYPELTPIKKELLPFPHLK